jgi:2-amino-4-hydroxy-6-hydroxymethyldihydropteridine diphosphokinase
VVEALLSFGANIGAARLTLHRAIEAFCDGRSVRLVARSSDYRTPPWGITAQPAFINLCIAVETTLAPRALLEHALAVEAAFGRDRAKEIPWGPRKLDIDILTYDDAAVDEPWLKLPHPYLLDRAFVLVPLSEIRPTLTISGLSIVDALARLDASGVERLAPAP